MAAKKEYLANDTAEGLVQRMRAAFDEKRHTRGCGSWVPSGSSATLKLTLLLESNSQLAVCPSPGQSPLCQEWVRIRYARSFQ